ncbi:hypothetical protein ACHQM5_010370 [Ranunculus cassubicifolius]
MSSNRLLEAQRCKESAEKLINREDYMGAREKLIQAKKYFPSLEHIESMLTVTDILSAASLEFPGCKIDYYWVLQLKPLANESDLRIQSQKLVSLLQPIKKSFPGTELALQLVKAAFVMLSDKEKRAAFDLKRVECWDKCGDFYCKDFVFDLGVGFGGKESVVSAQSSSGNKRVSISECSDGNNGVLKKMRLSNECAGQKDEAFLDNGSTILKSAKDEDEEKLESGFYNFAKDRKEDVFEVGQIWAAHHREKFPQRYALVNSTSNSDLSVIWLRPIPFMEEERRWCEAGFPVACGSFELDPDMSEESVSGTKLFSQICSWVHGVTEEQFEIYPKKGEIWAIYEDWDLAEWSSDLEIISSCKFKLVEILSDYSKYVGAHVAGLVKVDGFDNIFRREEDEEIDISFDLSPNNLYMFSHCIPAHRFKHGEVDGVEDGMFELDPLALADYDVSVSSCVEHSSTDISTVDDSPEFTPPTTSYSNTQSLKLNWFRNDFSIGQVWAVYNGQDGMPRRYCLVNSVTNYQVRVTFLEPHPSNDSEICWEKEKLPIVCGIFRVGKSAINMEMRYFSHSVKCQRSKNQFYYRIYPRKGEIWAMYINWSSKWKQTDFSNFQYRVVEILEDFSEGSGTKVARLGEVKGCMTFFQRQRHEGFDLIRAVPKEELLSFSHRIPAFRVPGIERYDIPESSVHLEPDALPPRARK